MKYDFFVAGRWRNKENIETIVKAIRVSKKTAFCFLENVYETPNAGSTYTEKLPQDHPFIKEIFDKDMEGQRNSKNFVLVFPAGVSAHTEAGVAYGMGMNCYAIGKPDKTESLYCLFDKVFPDLKSFQSWLDTQ